MQTVSDGDGSGVVSVVPLWATVPVTPTPQKKGPRKGASAFGSAFCHVLSDIAPIVAHAGREINTLNKTFRTLLRSKKIILKVKKEEISKTWGELHFLLGVGFEISFLFTY